MPTLPRQGYTQGRLVCQLQAFATQLDAEVNEMSNAAPTTAQCRLMQLSSSAGRALNLGSVAADQQRERCVGAAGDKATKAAAAQQPQCQRVAGHWPAMRGIASGWGEFGRFCAAIGGGRAS